MRVVLLVRIVTRLFSPIGKLRRGIHRLRQLLLSPWLELGLAAKRLGLTHDPAAQGTGASFANGWAVGIVRCILSRSQEGKWTFH